MRDGVNNRLERSGHNPLDFLLTKTGLPGSAVYEFPYTRQIIQPARNDELGFDQRGVGHGYVPAEGSTSITALKPVIVSTV